MKSAGEEGDTPRKPNKATQADDFFRQTPVAVARSDLARELRLRSSEPSAYAAFLGSVPGEETDEEFAAAVEELS